MQNSSIGGLTGRNSGVILASYSTVTVIGGGHTRVNAGGLTGTLESFPNTGRITASYATGAVSATGYNAVRGGLVGSSSSNASVIASSYCTSGGCIGSNVGGSLDATTQTATALQTPTAYTGIYANYNIDLNGDRVPDNPWNFGTSSQYPTLKTPTQRAVVIDYDNDNDGLIDVTSLSQLNAIRYDLNGDGLPIGTNADTIAYAGAFPGGDITASSGRMGCPSTGCTGYELLASLDFDSDGDGDVDANDHGGAYWNSGAGWQPIGPRSLTPYAGNFKGNGYTINNLFIDRNANDNQSLFGVVASNRIETLGVTNANVSGNAYTGILAGINNTTIVACYTTGKAQGSGNNTGGLVGYSTGTISASYSTTYVSGNNNVGGLVGYMQSGTITSSYSTGRVTRASGSATTIGGLIGNLNTGTVSINYWDTSTSGQATSAGGSGVVGKTTSELQSQTTYGATTNDPYYNWNANLDGQAGNDDPWTFGKTDQYPVLKYAGMDTTVQYNSQPPGKPDVAVTSNADTLYVRWTASSYATGYKVQWKSGMQSYDASREATTTATFLKIPLTTGTTYTVRVLANKTGASDAPSDEVMGVPGSTNYDSDGDGLIAITTLAQLNAIRHDLNGNGDATHADYDAAFPGRDTSSSARMGCLSGCTGYELLNDLDFDENNDGAITSADATYWNSGQGWEPIGDDSGNNYTADFKGNGFTISNLLISRSGVTDVGLFGAISNTSRIESLGVIDGDVAAWKWVGILVGTMRGEVVACYTTGKVSATGTSSGGLVGYLYNGTISTSYSNASLSGESNTGGLVGARFGGSITNSYSTGRVSGTGSNVGGLIGNVVSPGSVSNSYWDTFLSYHNTSAGGTGYATADLQRPNDYIGIYSSWNANIDGQAGNDDPWYFGATNQYPALKYAGMDTTVQFNLQPVVVTLALTPSSISENGGTSTVTATLAHPSSAATTITVRSVAGAYTVAAADSTITIPAGQTANASDTVVITAVNNTQDEPNRTVTMSAVMHNSQVAGRVAGATLTITDDDLAPMVTLTPNPASISENAAVSTVMASLSRPSNEATTITVRPLAGAYEVSATDSTITIAAGDTINASDTVVITSVNNTRDEPNRIVNLSGVSRNAQGAGSVTGTITLDDDDDPPDVTMVVSPASISENGGISTVTATLSHTSSDPTTITVTVAPVSPAVAGDYTISTPATLTVAAEQTMSAGTVTITGVNNADATGNKTVTVSSTLTNSVGTGSVTDVTLTLVDDDVPNVTLVLTPASITENAQVSTITATLDRVATTAATVTVSAMAVSPAVAGDFTLSTTTTLTFAANVTTSTGTVTITSVNDTTDAPDKEVTVSATVTGGNMAVLSSSETLTITDDDAPPRLSISSPSAVEGTALTFTVRLNAVSGKEVTVAYADAGTGTATSGTDYTALTAGTLTFAAGTTSQTIAVSVSDDGDDEQNETVIVTLSSATNATISTAQGTGTIIDDDGMPALSIGSPSVIEDATSATLTFQVYLRPAHDMLQVTVAYADAGTGTATSGTDYTALTAGTLTFAVGDTIQTIPVSVTDDSDDEQNETVIVELSSATNATISTADGTGTIIDDETPSANLDVDGDGRVRLFSDIILVIRYVLFFRNEALLRGNVIEPTATRTTAQEIEPYLDTLVNQNILDVDGDGDVRLFSDIILIIRYVLFFRNEALLRGNVIEQQATRTTAQEIEPFIRSLYPASHFQ